MTKTKLLMIVTAALLSRQSITATSSLPGNDSIAKPCDRTLLYNIGDMGSKYWRIPALVTTNSGTVIAAADKRNDSNNDLPHDIDIVVRRSADNGKSWGQPQMILATDSIGGYGDAALGVHRPSGDIVLVAAHGNGLWESTPDDRQYVVVTRSSDDGQTWSRPVDITDQLYSPEEGAAPIKAHSGFATSGTMLCDDNGRLWFVLVARTGDRKWGPLSCYVCHSDDGGYNWRIHPSPIDTNGDEAKIVQLADGSYLVSIRNRGKGERKFTRSADGETWTPLELQRGLVDPACNGDMIMLSPERLKALGLADDTGGNGLLVHSIANDRAQRRNVSIFTSPDNGQTWRRRIVITPYGSAYSALTVMADGTLGCLTEEESTEVGYRLWFTRVDMTGWAQK